MTADEERKDLALTRYAIEKADHRERLSYAAVLADLIQRSSLLQKELAEASGVTARTIRNIVQGKSAPQADKILALLRALDVDVDGDDDLDVRPYTKMLAQVIRRIAGEHRAAAVSDAIGVLSDAALAHPDQAVLARVTKISPPDVGRGGQDLETAPLDPAALAASTDDSAVDPARGEN
ncbi:MULTISPECIES: helix-turn-helix transcriptional regulator [Microbacterium]|uniref:helix-turn-helix domain-containing protein n=1 Tax=Microbacterium TaxID=33882 RepID=UPI00146AA240|nr:MULTISPECIES: helix-turn-helix transcriptional regulator [Microbacterium]